MIEELQRAHRLLCSRFVAEDRFRQAFGGSRADMNAVIAYLRLAVPLRPAVAPFFDAAYYAAMNADVLKPGDDPLLHFIETGITELRAPHPLIDLRFIASTDALILGETPDVDALMDVLDYDLASPSPYFDMDFYAARFGAVGGEPAPEGGLLRHFLLSGAASGHKPNAWLDPAWYASMYADVPKDRLAATRHFIIVGDTEGRDPGPDFSADLYCRRYTDIADSGMPPLLHYLVYGRAEGRQVSAGKPARQGGLAVARALPIGRPQPADAETLVAADSDMRGRIAARRQHRKDAVQAKAPALVAEPGIKKLRFAAAPKPRVSVLIPVFNEFDVTLSCLAALSAAKLGGMCEIIVADDCSTDPQMAALRAVKNLVLVRHAENLGFLRSCNAAFAKCRGEYVLLLNNDTEILPGALEALVAALDADPQVAAVGPMLLYPNGRLQEAGCFVKPNGETGMVGLFDDPEAAQYQRDRDVAYCSGAALMLRRELAPRDLFDEAYRPAYCEDVDLCLRLRAAGHRIRYVHTARVVHHLSVSSNATGIGRKLRGIARNQQTLLARWGDLIRKLDEVRVLAFYLPQFHPMPENDLWWGTGFTEWRNVTRAQPSYMGHYQPHLPTDLGFYDLRQKEALMAQAALAARYGVEGFVFYHYNFGKRRLLDRPLKLLRDNPDIAIRFCLCWANENWTKHWDGGTREMLVEQQYDAATISAVIADAVEHAGDPRAITVDGRPLFMVYRPLKLPDANGFAATCRAAFAKAGFPGVHLVYVESMEAVEAKTRPSDLGFDASVEFPPHGRAVPCEDSPAILKDNWAGYRYDYPQTVEVFTSGNGVDYPRYPTVFPSWDNTARQPDYGSSFDRASPEAFRVYVEEKLDEIRAFHDGGHRLLFVNAWNEWAEGAHLEPDTGYGHRWLEALRAAVEAKHLA